MHHYQLFGLLLAFSASLAQAAPPPASGNTGQPPAPETSISTPREAGDNTAAGTKPTPLAQAPKPDEHKLNKLKVYPCF